MLEEEVEARRGAADGEAPESAVRLDLDVDAYVPAEYVPFEAAKIDVHRRVSAAREPGELRELRDELRDRFGPPPDALENLISLQRARIEFGRAGAAAVEARGGRLTVSPVELESDQAAAVTDRVEGAMYEWRQRALSVRVPAEPEARLAAAVALAEALASVRSEAAPPEPVASGS
jgi:transcription-repair coupling factor (superfamily II helicase)